MRICSVLVYVIGFCIRRLEEKEYTTSGLSRRAAASIEAAAVSRRIELLTAIACEIYERSRANAAAEANIVTFEYDIHAVGDIELNSAKNSSESPVDENDEMDLDNDDTLVPGTDLTLYDNLCLATFSRLFQRLQHRQKGAPDFLFNLPVIPDSILHVLKMLMYSGTLPDSGAENALLRRKRKRGSDASQMQDLGTRIASMELLSHICLIEPVDATNHTTVVALSQLLWATTSSDFKTRTNAINVIVR